MFYYLPQDGEGFHAVREGYRLVDALNDAGYAAAVGTPRGRADTRFRSSASVLPADLAQQRIQSGDPVVFTRRGAWKCWGERAGRRFLLDLARFSERPEDGEPDGAVLRPWKEDGEDGASFAVGCAIPDAYFYDGRPKPEGHVAVDGPPDAVDPERLSRENPALWLHPLPAADEREQAAVLQSSEALIALRDDAGAALTRLHALAAGCVVIGSRAAHRWCSFRVDPQETRAACAAIMDEAHRGARASARAQAAATASRYRARLRRPSVRSAAAAITGSRAP